MHHIITYRQHECIDSLWYLEQKHMSDNKILYITQEIAPYVSETEFSVLGRTLPPKMQERGFEVRTFMPKYGCINERRNQLHEVIRLSGMNIIINDSDHPLIIKVASLQPSRIQIYFIDNEDYFQKCNDDIDEKGSNRNDNDERSIFFARGTMETVKKLNWIPAVVHCQGWISALAPLYLRTMYAENPAFTDAKIVYAITGDKFEGLYTSELIEKLKMDGIEIENTKTLDGVDIDINTIHKLAIDHSDGVIFNHADIDEELIKYVKAKGIPCLSYEKYSEGMDSLTEFYKSFIQNNDTDEN